MILLEVRDHIKQCKQINLNDLARHFQHDPEAMREMLSHWIRKGAIRKMPKPAGCGIKCVACKPSIAEIYCYCG